MSIFDQFPTFDLGDILLREIKNSDASYYYNYMANPSMLPFLSKLTIPTNIEMAEQELRYWGGLFYNKRSFYWGIALKENDQLIGTVGFNNISFFHRKGEISYDLDENFWKRGIMLKSVKKILQFADNMLMLARIQATVLVYNQPSINLLERCGFNVEGLLKKYEIVNNQHQDYYMYAKVI